MFRPEMLESMGLPRDMKCYGWGLSLERPTMISKSTLLFTHLGTATHWTSYNMRCSEAVLPIS